MKEEDGWVEEYPRGVYLGRVMGASLWKRHLKEWGPQES